MNGVEKQILKTAANIIEGELEDGDNVDTGPCGNILGGGPECDRGYECESCWATFGPKDPALTFYPLDS